MPTFVCQWTKKITLVETIMHFTEATEKPAVTMATSNMVCYLAQGLGFKLNAYLRWFLMPNLHRINIPNPVLFISKFIKNNKWGRGNDTKLCMSTNKLPMNIPNDKNRLFNLTLVSYSCMVKKVTLVSMFASETALKRFQSL